MNWIFYLEKYNADKKLLISLEHEIERLEHIGLADERLPELRQNAELLRCNLRRADDLLNCYINAAHTPRDAAMRAKEQLYLTLRYKQEMTMEEVAEAMEISRDTAYRIRRRIIARGDVFATVAAAGTQTKPYAAYAVSVSDMQRAPAPASPSADGCRAQLHKESPDRSDQSSTRRVFSASDIYSRKLRF